MCSQEVTLKNKRIIVTTDSLLWMLLRVALPVIQIVITVNLFMDDFQQYNNL